MLFCCAGVSGEDSQELALWHHNIHILSHVSLTTATSFSLSVVHPFLSQSRQLRALSTLLKTTSMSPQYAKSRTALNPTGGERRATSSTPNPIFLFWENCIKTLTGSYQHKSLIFEGVSLEGKNADLGPWRLRTFGVWHLLYFCSRTFGYGGDVSAGSLIWIQIKWNKMGDNHCWSNSDLNSDSEITCDL